MKSIIRLSIFYSVLILAGCGQPKIDASDAESLEASLASLYQRLPIEESNLLKLNMEALNGYFQRRVYKGEAVEDAQREYLAMLDGKTPADINEKVDELSPFGVSRPIKN
ncbi:DUF6694 family lipoprotein [Pseudomonas putida]|uniref:Lipoprotein n=1 Tax=Pseudomonas putida TaxID=303 RepID=A0A8I1JKV8_PSEPU|nr:DUF6694 family lipoprotein [Pseudomonas putida]MBI6885144.1 hypothetical protein [Pseudomonas putida]